MLRDNPGGFALKNKTFKYPENSNALKTLHVSLNIIADTICFEVRFLIDTCLDYKLNPNKHI